MDAERFLSDGLRQAADDAPTWDDALLDEAVVQAHRPHRTRWLWVGLAGLLVVAVAITVVLQSRGRRPSPQIAGPSPAAGTPSDLAMQTPSDPPSEVVSRPMVGVPLAGTTWVVDNLDGHIGKLRETKRPWLRFNPDGTLDGYDGCNTLVGSYSVSGTSVSVQDLGGTQKACADNPTADFSNALAQVHTYDLGGVEQTSLTLSNREGLDLMYMHRFNETGEAAPDKPMLRIRNLTGRDITTMTVGTATGKQTFGPIKAGESSDYVPTTVYSYAVFAITFADGRVIDTGAADWVGETPLGPGWYTYVIRLAATNPPAVLSGLEQVGVLEQ